MNTNEFLKEIYFLIGCSRFVPAEYTSQVTVVIPDYYSFAGGNRGVDLYFNTDIVEIADELHDKFIDLIESFNQYVDEFEKIVIL